MAFALKRAIELPRQEMRSSQVPTAAGEGGRADLEHRFCAQLDHIERVANAMARRSGFPPDDRPDVVSWVKLRLIESDYALLAKYRGESSLQSYLTIVIVRLVKDYRTQLWGRWRPSASATRLGGLAIRLETLLSRDGLTVDQAIEMLRAEGHGEGEVRQLFAQLPRRLPVRPRVENEEALAILADDSATDAPLSREIEESSKQQIFEILAAAIGDLSVEEQVMLRLRYWHGMSTADIARTLRISAKPLYRRIDRLNAFLRRRLELAGITGEEVRVLLEIEECS